MEEILLSYGLPGVVIIAMAYAIRVLYKENIRLQTVCKEENDRHQGEKSDLIGRVIESEIATRMALEKMVEGLATQDLLSRFIESQRTPPKND